MTVKVIKHAVHEAVDTAERAVKRDVQTQVKVWSQSRVELMRMFAALGAAGT